MVPVGVESEFSLSIVVAENSRGEKPKIFQSFNAMFSQKFLDWHPKPNGTRVKDLSKRCGEV